MTQNLETGYRWIQCSDIGRFPSYSKLLLPALLSLENFQALQGKQIFK